MRTRTHAHTHTTRQGFERAGEQGYLLRDLRSDAAAFDKEVPGEMQYGRFNNPHFDARGGTQTHIHQATIHEMVTRVRLLDVGRIPRENELTMPFRRGEEDKESRSRLRVDEVPRRQ